jgi:hypothetical protein
MRTQTGIEGYGMNLMDEYVDWARKGKFNNQKKVKTRYIQHEKCLMLQYGRYYIKSCEDNPATVQRKIRWYRTHIKNLKNIKRLMI